MMFEAGSIGGHEFAFDQPPQRIADPEAGTRQVFDTEPRLDATAGCEQFLAQHARQETAIDGRSRKTCTKIEEDIGDRAFADFIPLVGKEHLVKIGRKCRTRGIIALTGRRLQPQPGIAGAKALRRKRHSPALLYPGQWSGRNLHLPGAIEGDPHPETFCASDRSEGRINPRLVAGEAERDGASAKAGPVLPFPDQPGPVPAEGFDELQPRLAKRAFHNASSYSPSAVESCTTPPPTFRTASPSSWRDSVRMATLNSALVSGAIQPIAPQ